MTPTKKRKIDIRNFVLFALFAVFLALQLTSYYVYKNDVSNELASFKLAEKRSVYLVTEHMKTLADLVIEDVLVLSRDTEYAQIEQLNSAAKTRLEQRFLDTITLHKIYDQIRFIDTSGKERLRVNYNRGNPYVVSEDELQDKSDRYYFEKSIGLSINEVFISSFDLNIENGSIETPIKPVIRVATPVFGPTGEKLGVLVVNYSGNDLISIVDNTQTQGETYIVNDEGYWLKGSTPEQEWGFMYPEKKDETFGKYYPDVWEKFSKTDVAQVITGKGLFTMITANPQDLAQDKSLFVNTPYSVEYGELSEEQESWKIITFVPSNILYGRSDTLRNILIVGNIVLAAFLTVMYLVISTSIKHDREQSNQISKLNVLLKLINKLLRHDLANAFVSIKYSYELFQKHGDKDLLKEGFTKAQKGIETIDQMKILEGLIEADAELTKQDLSEVISSVKEEYDIEINTEGNCTVLCDPAIYSVVRNIVNNAIMHGSAEKIDIQITCDKKFATLKIADYGTGIPDEIKEKVFEEGYKSGATGNTGLGLYIVAETVKRYGGTIRVEDNKPNGTVFVITLPKA